MITIYKQNKIFLARKQKKMVSILQPRKMCFSVKSTENSIVPLQNEIHNFALALGIPQLFTKDSCLYSPDEVSQ